MTRADRDYNFKHPHGGLEMKKCVPHWLRHHYTDHCGGHFHGHLPSAYYDDLTYSEELAHLIHDIKELQDLLFGGDLVEMYNLIMSLLAFFDPVFGRINEYEALIPEGERYKDVLKKADYVMRTFVTTKFDRLDEFVYLKNEGFSVKEGETNDTYPEVYEKTAQILPEVLQALDFTHRYWKIAFFTPIDYTGSFNVVLKLTSGDDFPTHLANIYYCMEHVNWLTEQVKRHDDEIKAIQAELVKIWNEINNINGEISNIWQYINTIIEALGDDDETSITLTIQKTYATTLTTNDFVQLWSETNSACYWSGQGGAENFITIPVSEMDTVKMCVPSCRVTGNRPAISTVNMQQAIQEGTNLVINFDAYEQGLKATVPYNVAIDFFIVGTKKYTIGGTASGTSTNITAEPEATADTVILTADTLEDIALLDGAFIVAEDTEQENDNV